MLALAFGIFGLIVGSFLNVIILRHGVRSIGGRSGCMSCGRQLPWYDMVPVFSWFALGGRCRMCRGRISVQYPLVEAATGVSFAAIGYWVSTPSFSSSLVGEILVALYLGIVALLICIAAYDFLHTIIPDEWAYLFAGLALVSGFFAPSPAGYNTWELVLAGPIAAAPLFGLWLFSRGQWMGLGDAKLTLGIGWLLGPILGLLAVFGAFVTGAVISLILLFFSSEQWRKIMRLLTPTSISQRPAWGFTMKSEIPFGPFLICSCIIIWFASLYGIDTLRIFGPLL